MPVEEALKHNNSKKQSVTCDEFRTLSVFINILGAEILTALIVSHQYR